jgi:sugar phosphate isomerase/epimerase
MRRRAFLGGLAALGVGGAWAVREGRAGDAAPGGASGSGPAGAGSALSSPGGASRGLVDPSSFPEVWGVQLYTVRDRMAEDVPGTLRAVAEMGYGEVEFAGLFGTSPRDMRAMLDDLGLRAASSHHGIDEIRGDWESVLDGAETLGQSQVVLPSLPREARTAEGLRALAEEMNRAGEAARARGLAFGFHNHDFEVTPLESVDVRPLNILLAATDEELVSFQLDLFWAVHGGTDPLDWFRGSPGRFRSVHVKDRTASGEMVAVGQGVLDFARLLTVGEEVGGVRHAFVEHDRPGDSLASIRTSIAHLNTLRSQG